MPFRQAIAPVSALLFSAALLLMGNGLQNILLPIRADLDAFSNFQIGLLGSFYFLGFAIGCLAAPWFIGSVGHIRAYLAFVSVASTVALLHALTDNPIIWWGLRVITGFCFAALFVVIESWLNARSELEMRGTVFSVYTVIQLTVVAIGQIMLAVGNPDEFILFALASVLISLAAVPVALTRSISPDPIPVVFPRLVRLYSLSPVGFIGCLSYGFTAGTIWSYGAVFAQNIGLDTTNIGLFMSAIILGGALGQFPLGRLSDRIDRRLVIVATCVAGSIVSFTFVTTLGQMEARDSNLIFVFGALIGALTFPLYVLSVAHANDLAEAPDYVETASGLLLIFGLGAIAGPPLVSFVISYSSYEMLFGAIALAQILTAIFVGLRIMVSAPAKTEAKVEFDDALVAAEILAPLEVIHTKEEAPSEQAQQ